MKAMIKSTLPLGLTALIGIGLFVTVYQLRHSRRRERLMTL